MQAGTQLSHVLEQQEIAGAAAAIDNLTLRREASGGRPLRLHEDGRHADTAGHQQVEVLSAGLREALAEWPEHEHARARHGALEQRGAAADGLGEDLGLAAVP